MLRNMSKRIIFSVWSDLIDNHPSAPNEKVRSFNLYKDKLVEKQKRYAHLCGADYNQFVPKENNYVDVQFYKLQQTENLLQYYDEVLYLDLDVIPRTNKIIFDSFNLDDVSVYSMPVQLSDNFIKTNIKDNKFSSMNKYSKMSCKRAMLLLDDVYGDNNIANTGVFCLNKRSSEALKFTERLPEVKTKFLMAVEDNLYPKEMSSSWVENNEVFLSYILDRYSVPNNNIGQVWNYILDEFIKEPTDACYFQHQVNKEFHNVME